ncbi:histone methyltransferase set2 [Podila horticola]|nr:histone methyltransferase set2 [Podila horticola]
MNKFVTGIPLADLFHDHEETHSDHLEYQGSNIEDGDDDDPLPIQRRRHLHSRQGRRIRLIESDDEEEQDNQPNDESEEETIRTFDRNYMSSSSGLSSPCDDLDSQLSLTPPPSPPIRPKQIPPSIKHLPPSTKHLPSVVEEAQSNYQTIDHNIYRGNNTGNPPMNDAFPCQCKYNPNRDPRWKACGSDCINRNLFVECIEDDCPCGSYCLNRRFQTMANAEVDVVRTEKKGFGLRAKQNIEAGEFVMEYIGEVLPHASFIKRTREYSLAGVEHFYFMSLQADEVIDATKKGCLARFINHSCNPNCHLEKWVVGPKLRIGIFSIKGISAGDELTFDYQFERYGVEAQKCYCGEANCTGFIGRNNRTSIIRHDFYNYSYNLAEDADQDEIELEHEIILRAPKKDKILYESGYRDRYQEAPAAPLGIEDPTLMEKLARIMFMKPKVPKSKRLLAKLMATTDRACLRRFLVLHGLVILKAWLRQYKDEADIVMGIMILLPSLPLVTRNAIEDSMIEDAVHEIANGPECPSKDMAKNILMDWKDLKSTYRIPKAKKNAQAQSQSTPSDASGTPVDEPIGLVSPSDSSSFISADIYPSCKRLQDDEPMQSPVVEKKTRFDVLSEVAYDAQEPELNSHSYSQEHQQYESFQWHQEYHVSPHSNRSSGYERDLHLSSPDHKTEEPAPSETRRPEVNTRDGDYDSRFDEQWKYRDRHQDYYRDHERDRERNGNRDRERNRDQEKYHRDYSDNPRQSGSLEDRERDRERYPRDRPSSPSRWNQVSPRDSCYQLTSPGSRQGEWRDVPSKGSRNRSRSASPSSPRSSLPSAADLVPRPTIFTGRHAQYRQSSSTPVSPRTVTPTTALAVSMPLALTIQDNDDATHERRDDPSNVTVEAAIQKEAVVSTVTPPEAVSTTSSRQLSPRRDDQYREHQDYHQYPQHQYRGKFHNENGHNMSNNNNSSRNHNNHNKYNNRHFENRDRYRYSSNQNRSYHHRSCGPHYSKPSFHRQPYRETHHRPYQSAAPQDRPYQSMAQQENVSAPVTAPAPATSAATLPSGWACAKDSERRVYYYHELTRVTQWEIPVTEDPAKKQEIAIPGQSSPDSRMDTRAAVHSSMEEYHRGPEYTVGYPEYAGREMRGSDHAPLRDDHAGQVPGATWNSFDGGFRNQVKPLNERDLKAAISSTVIKTMTKYRIKLESSDAFKRQARKITHLVADKEMRTLPFLNGQLTELNEEMKEKIRRFTRDFLAKTFKKQEEQYRLEQDQRSTVDALVNGVANGGSHITITGVPPTPASSSGSVSSSSTQRRSSVGPGQERYPPYGQQGFGLKYVGYEDVDVDDEDDIVYGRDSDNDGHDRDEDDEDLSTIPKRRDHHHMGHYEEDADVAAVPSSSVEP